MSIRLEQVNSPPEQDREDLLAIYRADPEALRQALENELPDSDIAGMLDTLISSPDHELWAVRFNSRLIASMVATPEQPDSMFLQALAVRPSSRDRGISARLLQHYSARIGDACQRLLLQQPATPDADLLPLAIQGFKQHPRQDELLEFRRPPCGGL